MRINHNVTALNTYRQLSNNSSNQSKAIEKLSSGLRINRAGDDAAGLAISEKMRGQIRGLDQASRNAQDGISLIQTAEGALNETHDILQRMRELAVQASNDTNTDTDRGAIQSEVNQLTSEINRIGNTTQFNTKNLLNGDVSDKAGIVTAGTLTAGATTLGNLKLDEKSGLAAGNYNVVITDSVGKSTTNTGAATAGVSGVSIDPASTLAAGNYVVDVAKSQAKSTTLSTAADSVTGVSINPNSGLADGAHTVNITRADSVATGAFTGANTGLTADGVTITGTAGASGTYTVKTEAVLGAVGTTGTATASAGTAGVISLNLDNAATNSTLSNATGYRLAYTDHGGITGVTLQDSTGTAISDEVILDDNTQHYQFNAVGAPTTSLGISFDTLTSASTTLNAEVGKYHTFDVSTKLTLNDGTSDVGTATLAAGDASTSTAIVSSGGDTFTFAHGAASTLVSGKSDTFAITNTLTAKFDGGSATTFTAGSTVNFANGVSVATDSDISKYAATVAGEDYSIGVATNDTYTATVKADTGGGVAGATAAGAQTVTLTNSGSFNLGNGVTITTGTLAAAGTHTFSVADSTVTNAALVNTGTSSTVATQNNISANSTLDFGNGLKVDVGAKTNGTASFTVSGSVKDQSLSMQIGANEGQSFAVSVNDMRSKALGITGTANTAGFTHDNSVTDGTNNTLNEAALDLSTSANASAAITKIDSAIKTVSSERAKLGAYQNRLDHTINNLNTSSENLTSAESRVRDVDMAKEMMNQTKSSILAQASQAMLAQANQQPQGVLQLLRG